MAISYLRKYILADIAEFVALIHIISINQMRNNSVSRTVLTVYVLKTATTATCILADRGGMRDKTKYLATT